MRPLVFWQNIPSIHQAPLARALGRCWDGQVLVVTEGAVPTRRVTQGWSAPTYEPAQLLVSPDREKRSGLLERVADERSVHVFSGLFAYPDTAWTLKRAAASDALLGVFLEPLREDDLPRAAIRALIHRLLALRWRRRLDFLLVTGATGTDRYRELGFPGDRIFPFCYTVTRHPGPRSSLSALRHHVRLLFVGRLIRRKGLHHLLEALGILRSDTWTLDVIGGGPEERHRRLQSERLGIGERIRWRGQLANQEARMYMAKADIMILPSLHDGWGAVVNEALFAGTRALVSTACGSADLAMQAPTGRTFRAGSPTALANELQRMIDLGPVSSAERSKTGAWADRAIAPGVVAMYLKNIIGFVEGARPRPSAPWMSGPVGEP